MKPPHLTPPCPAKGALAARGWGPLTHVLNTHHHADHTGGNLALAAAFPSCAVVGPAGEAARIPGITAEVTDRVTE